MAYLVKRYYVRYVHVYDQHELVSFHYWLTHLSHNFILRMSISLSARIE